MPNVNDLKTSKYLQKHEVEPPIEVTIKSYEEVNMARDGESPEMKWVLHFFEAKPISLNVTNGEMISYIMEHTYGETQMPSDFDTWLNKKIVLYNDPTVGYAGKRTGGIRVRPPVLNTTAGVTPPQQRQYNNSAEEKPPVGEDTTDYDEELPEALR